MRFPGTVAEPGCSRGLRLVRHGARGAGRPASAPPDNTGPAAANAYGRAFVTPFTVPVTLEVPDGRPGPGWCLSGTARPCKRPQELGDRAADLTGRILLEEVEPRDRDLP